MDNNQIKRRKDRRQISFVYGKNQLNKAAKNIVGALERKEPVSPDDEEIVENWRASHTHVLNTWQIILRRKIQGKKVVFAQRLKRKSTIYDKLKRYKDMKPARMHDIAGCRLIFQNEKDMMEYIELLHKSTGFHHSRKEKQCKDYIKYPKDSGYRGIHDVYAYQSKKGKDRSAEWDGLLVEIQYRTIYQHAWATALEIADTLTASRVKFGQGDEIQKEFFVYASEIIARVYENRKSYKSDLTNQEVIDRFNELERKLHLMQRLKYLKILSKFPDIFKRNILIHSTIKDGNPSLDIKGYNSLSKANKSYFDIEKKYPDDDIVLVKSSDKKSILEAYRNYFADAKDFTEYIEDGLKRLSTIPHSK